MEATSNNAGGARRRNPAGQRYKNFVFTLNNYTEEEYTWITTTFPEWCTWLCVAKEVGESGTPHLQGACVLKKRTTRSTIARLEGFKRAWHHQMNGKPEHSLAYTSKQDKSPFVFGEFATRGQGRRNDLASTTKEILAGKNMAELAKEDVAHAVVIVKYHKGLQFLNNLVQVRRTEKPRVYWLHGPTGVGKTRIAHEFAQHMEIPADRQHIWISRGTFQWFDGYDGQPLAIMDDFRSKQLPNFAYLLRLLDRYDMAVPFKGGFTEWRPKVIIFTCPMSPDVCFERRKEHVPEDINQLNRRLTLVVDIPKELNDVERSNVLIDMARAGGFPVVVNWAEELAEDDVAAQMMVDLSHVTLAQPEYPCSEEERSLYEALSLEEKELVEMNEVSDVHSHDSSSENFFVPATLVPIEGDTSPESDSE